MSDKQYPSWCCQRCGDRIGYVGRFLEFIATPILWAAKSIYHDCPGLFTLPAKKVSKGKSDERCYDFPIFGGADSTIKKQS